MFYFGFELLFLDLNCLLNLDLNLLEFIVYYFINFEISIFDLLSSAMLVVVFY